MASEQRKTGGSASAAVAALAARFETLERAGALPGRDHAFVGALRREALARFVRDGFPTTRDEEWRFTSTAAIAALRFAEPATAPVEVAKLDVDRFRLAGASVEMVLVDGRFAPSLSAPGQPGTSRAGSLARALAGDPGSLELDGIAPWLGRLAADGGTVFQALNLALFEDGGFLRVPAGVTLEGPVHVLHIVTAAGNGAARLALPRTLVVIETAASARLVESYVALGALGDLAVSPSLTVAATEILLGEDAMLEHDRLVDLPAAASLVAGTEVRQERGSRYLSRSFSLGGALVRNDHRAVQAGEGTETVLDGLYVATGSEHVDNHTTIDHAHPHGSSRELYKGILDGRGHGVFNGRVLVRKDAQKTDSRQTNKNLLLSREALVDTKPELQILADDVKCAHGATIGQLDEQALFYLRSRGLDEAESRSLLTLAFGREVVERVRDEGLRARLGALIGARLGRGASNAKENA